MHWFHRQSDWRPSRESVVARLTRRLKRDDSSGCLLWTGGRDRWGYGKIDLRIGASERFTVQVHRFRYALSIGRWPVLSVLHGCDTPACAETTHLREGSHEENMADCVLRGRKPSAFAGVRGVLFKLSEADVDRLLSLRGRLPARDVAAELAVSPVTVWRYWRGWRPSALRPQEVRSCTP